MVMVMVMGRRAKRARPIKDLESKFLTMVYVNNQIDLLGICNIYCLFCFGLQLSRVCVGLLALVTASARRRQQCRRGPAATAGGGGAKVSMSTVDEVVDKKAERRRLMSSDKFNRIGFKEEKVGFAGSGNEQHLTKA